MKTLLCIAAFLITLPGYSQNIFRGKVINAKTKEALPFVNIAVKGTARGTTSDVEGRFIMNWEGSSSTIVFSFVGYDKLEFTVTREMKGLQIVSLQEKTTELQEVVIRPGDNPALKIILKATEHKALNDPENLPSFKYNSYNKLYLTMEGTPPDTTAATDNKTPDDSTARQKSDARKIRNFNKFTNTHHIFVTESYTERIFLKPGLSNETVIANKMTGVKDPFFAFIATNFQPFTFYQDFIPLFGKNYLNPISKGSTERYDFTLMDTVYHQSDSVFIISFEPLPGKQFDGMKGQIYISNNGWAIEHVIAQPADDKVLIESRIQQKYEKVGAHWFPVQLNAELRFKEYKIGSKKLMYVSRSYISNIDLHAAISKKDFGLLNVDYDPMANRRDSLFWNMHRTDSLKEKEKSTYQFYDSLGPKLNKLNRSMKIMEGLILGHIQAGPFNLPVAQFVKLNKYEEMRLGVGFQTNEKISRFFSLEGYAGYGFKDKAWKYGGGLKLNVIPAKDGFIRFAYSQDLNEPGGPGFMKAPGSSVNNQSIRNWLGLQMDSVQEYKVEFGIRPMRYTQANFFLRQQNRNPTYNYSYITETDQAGLRKNYIVTEAGMQFRYAFQERYIQVGNGKVVTNYAFPQVNVFLSKAVSGLGDGQYDFTKVQLLLDQRWQTRGFGKTTIQIDAGQLFGSAPYSYLFIGKGSKLDKASFLNSFVVNNYFQTMSLYEFLSDRYAYLFLSHNFGRIAGTKSRYFRPEFGITQSIGFGSLNHPEAHQGVIFKTMEKGFYESGATLNNILRFKYVRMLYYGIGLGAYYRYGEYASPNSSDNFAVKIIMSASL